MVKVIMYSPSDYTGDDALEIVQMAISIHGAEFHRRVGAEFSCSVAESDVTSFVAWLEGYGFHRR